MQSFKRDVPVARAGDRAGLCFAQLPAAKLERTFVSAPGLLQETTCCVCCVDKCRFYQGGLQLVNAWQLLMHALCAHSSTTTHALPPSL